MQYKVPQNIDQEDKILGPLTFVQFIYVLVGGAVVLILFTILRFSIFFFLLALPIIILTAAMALIKVQDQPFSHFLLYFIVYLRQPKRRIWHEHMSNAAEDPDFFTQSTEEIFAPAPPKPLKLRGADEAAEERPSTDQADPSLTTPLIPQAELVQSPPTDQTLTDQALTGQSPASSVPTTLNSANSTSTDRSPAPPAPLKPARKLAIKLGNG